METSSGCKVRSFLLLDDHPMQLYPQCSVMMRNLKKCWVVYWVFCRHFFSTKTMPAWGARLDRDSDDVAPLPQQFGEDDVDASRPKHFSLPPHRRVVNNKQKPHCCLSAQGLHGNHNGGPTAYWCCPCM